MPANPKSHIHRHTGSTRLASPPHVIFTVHQRTSTDSTMRSLPFKNTGVTREPLLRDRQGPVVISLSIGGQAVYYIFAGHASNSWQSAHVNIFSHVFNNNNDNNNNT